MKILKLKTEQPYLNPELICKHPNAKYISSIFNTGQLQFMLYPEMW